MEKETKKIADCRVAFLTLGCKVNSYETEAMQALLLEQGATITSFEEQADIYVINTCSVTNVADKKSRQMLHRAKKNNPDAIIAAAGCYVQTVSEETLKESGIDVIIGNNQKKDIVRILEEHLAGIENERLNIAKETEYEEIGFGSAGLEHTRAYLKIQDGCNQFCSYCIIPYARGRIRSRKPEEVLKEATRLAEQGFKEIVLTGIHLSSYGQPAAEGEQPLLVLIGKLNEIKGLERIRLGSLEPRIITEKFVKTLCGYEKVCPHFHLSLQSGSDTVLKRMNRRYTTKEYQESVEILRTYYEKPAITTDIIVGFPQETEEEFAETLAYAETIGFSKIHVFKYSRRKGTVADRMDGQVPEQVKNERSDRLIEVEERLGLEYRAQFVGSTQKVLFEEQTEIDGESYQTGYNERYIRMLVKQTEPMENSIVSVCVDAEMAGKEAMCCHLE